MLEERGSLAKGRGEEPRIVLGVVASERLGRTLAVDNLRGRRCSYACSYCEVRQGVMRERSRSRHFEPETVVGAVRAALEADVDPIDHIAIVPAGEATLDAGLGALVEGLQGLGAPVAVFTNGSLLSRDDVRRELGLADWVSMKVDAPDATTWTKINGPFAPLDFDVVVQGMRVFAASFRGTLVTETMLVHHVNTSRTDVEDIADLVSVVDPDVAYLTWAADGADTELARAILSAARDIFAERVERAVAVPPRADRAADRRIHLRRLTRAPSPRAAASYVASDAV